MPSDILKKYILYLYSKILLLINLLFFPPKILPVGVQNKNILGKRVKSNHYGSRLLGIRILENVNNIGQNEILGLLRWQPKPAGWRHIRIDLTNISGKLTHNVKFWLRFLVYNFTAVYSAEGMSIIFTFRAGKHII